MAGVAPLSLVWGHRSSSLAALVFGGYFCVLVQKSMEGEERLLSSIIQGIKGKWFRGSRCRPTKCPLESVGPLRG